MSVSKKGANRRLSSKFVNEDVFERLALPGSEIGLYLTDQSSARDFASDAFRRFRRQVQQAPCSKMRFLSLTAQMKEKQIEFMRLFSKIACARAFLQSFISSGNLLRV